MQEWRSIWKDMKNDMERNGEWRYHMGIEWRLKESVWDNGDVM